MKGFLVLSVLAAGVSLAVAAHATASAEGGAASRIAAASAADAEELGVIHMTKDQCSSVLYVDVEHEKYWVRHWQKIERGKWTRYTPQWKGTIPIQGGQRFLWKCGDTQERAWCPKEAKTISVFHSTTSREIIWNCETP